MPNMIGDKPRIPRPVWFLGWTSLFTDAASRADLSAAAGVPLRACSARAPVSLGIIEGVAEGLNSLLKVISGYWSDRRARRRPIVIARIRALVDRSSVHRADDRLAAGAADPRARSHRQGHPRSAPRRVARARFATASTRGRIFRFHRGDGSTPARSSGRSSRQSFCSSPPNATGCCLRSPRFRARSPVAMLFFVKEDDTVDEPVNQPALRPTTSEPPKHPKLEHPRTSRRELVSLMIVLLIFSLGNSADAFLLLRLADALGGATYVPLLWAAIHVVKSSLSTWGGASLGSDGAQAADRRRLGRYALVYLGFAMSTSATAFIAWFLFYGVYFALAEGAEKALVADLHAARSARRRLRAVQRERWACGALIASVLFGVLYEHFGSPRRIHDGRRARRRGGGVAAVHSHRYNQRFRCVTILVTNDDGVHSEGIKALAGGARSHLGDVTDRRADAGGERHRPRADAAASAADRDDRAEDVFAHRRHADRLRQPARSRMSSRRKPDLIVSGINKGWNLGDDVTYSGTVSGALEGALLGIPSDRGVDAEYHRATSSSSVPRRRPRRSSRSWSSSAACRSSRSSTSTCRSGRNKGFRVTVQAKRNHITVVDERHRPAQAAVLLDRRRGERVGAARPLGLPGRARRLHLDHAAAARHDRARCA